MMDRKFPGLPIHSDEDLETALDAFPEMMRHEALRHQATYRRAVEEALEDPNSSDDIGEA